MVVAYSHSGNRLPGIDAWARAEPSILHCNPGFLSPISSARFQIARQMPFQRFEILRNHLISGSGRNKMEVKKGRNNTLEGVHKLPWIHLLFLRFCLHLESKKTRHDHLNPKNPILRRGWWPRNFPDLADLFNTIKTKSQSESIWMFFGCSRQASHQIHDNVSSGVPTLFWLKNRRGGTPERGVTRCREAKVKLVGFAAIQQGGVRNTGGGRGAWYLVICSTARSCLNLKPSSEPQSTKQTVSTYLDSILQPFDKG